jgi:predicted ATP-dependent Lon-type protease
MNLAVKYIGNHIYEIALVAERKSGKIQGYCMTFQAKNKNEIGKWFDYFNAYAKKINDDPKYEEDEMIMFKANLD